MRAGEREMSQTVSHQDAVAYSAEAFTLLGISFLITALRTYYRARVVKVKRFQADDYFVLIAAVSPVSFPSTGPGHASLVPNSRLRP